MFGSIGRFQDGSDDHGGVSTHDGPLVGGKQLPRSVRALLTDSNGLGNVIHPVSQLLAEVALGKVHSCADSDAWPMIVSLLY